jgi:hypothetical protein
MTLRRGGGVETLDLQTRPTAATSSPPSTPRSPAAPAASLDYLADLARSATRLAELFEGYFRERAAAQEAAEASVAAAPARMI